MEAVGNMSLSDLLEKEMEPLSLDDDDTLHTRDSLRNHKTPTTTTTRRGGKKGQAQENSLSELLESLNASWAKDVADEYDGDDEFFGEKNEDDAWTMSEVTVDSRDLVRQQRTKKGKSTRGAKKDKFTSKE